ncbi:MAG: hypothetical protein K2G86_10425 [Prevotella sp.]|nr:hypothetical protein [Prevotella sp.]MDE6354935.1 hypothetical protein [Prevotella sp.]
MSNVITLQQSVLADVVELMGDNDAMKSLRKFLDELKGRDSDVMTEKERQEVLNDIREGLREIRMAQQGKIRLQSARDFLYEIRN